MYHFAQKSRITLIETRVEVFVQKVSKALEHINPSVWIRQAAILDPRQRVIEFLGNCSSGFAIPQYNGLIPVGELPNRGNNNSCPSPKRLRYPPALYACKNFIH